MKSQLVKKLLAGSLATALTISLMACGGSAPAANEAAETPADTTEVAAEAPRRGYCGSRAGGRGVSLHGINRRGW